MTEQEIVDSWNKYSNYKFYSIDDIDAIIGKRTPTEMGEWIDFSNFRWTDSWIYLNENNQFVSTDKPSSIIDMEEYKYVFSTSN